MNSDEELQTFKKLDLVLVAQSLGFVVDKKKSGPNSFFLEGLGEKIVVSKKPAAWCFFSLTDQKKNGTAIDFLFFYKGLNLGQARKFLREFSGSVMPTPSPPVSFPTAQNFDFDFSGWEEAQCHPYLLNSRGLSMGTLLLPKFSNRIFSDSRRNVVFPHFDLSGKKIIGAELKNKNFTGFSAGGKKGLWLSANFEDHTNFLAICESGIDCISLEQILRSDPDRSGVDRIAYASTGGAMGKSQEEILLNVLKKNKNLDCILIATDADEAGDRLEGQICCVLPGDVQVFRMRPLNGKDWNEELLQRMRA
jgi:hypothetical protein